MPNIGEEICGDYLKYVLKCDFVSHNITNPDIQGEIDVIGINLKTKCVYICEVATHTGGLQYVKNKRPDDYNKFVSKFEKDLDYANKYFNNYTIIPMLWSPIVRISSERAKYNTNDELNKVRAKIKSDYGLNLELIINDIYAEALTELKEIAIKETAKFNSNVMRVFQIEMYLERHVKRMQKKKR